MSFAARSLPPSDRHDAPDIGEIYAAFPKPVAQAETDFFLGVSHAVFMIGLDHKASRDAFLHALDCSAKRRPDQLRLALAVLRDRAEAMAKQTAELEKKLAAHIGVKP